MLKRMARLHTIEEFKAQIDLLRQYVPDIVITTDIITGFSDETEEDYACTRKALQDIRFDGAFIYKYSVRPGTPAAKLPDNVPLHVKNGRNNELLNLQKKITEENNRRRLGKTVTVFVEKTNWKNANEVVSRTCADQKNIFPGTSALIGTWVDV